MMMTIDTNELKKMMMMKIVDYLRKIEVESLSVLVILCSVL